MNENIIIANVNGLCKFCLGETNFQNICEQQDGNDENFGEMLKNCFGILLTPSEGPQLICESCVTRLSDAMAFKQEILTTQQILQNGKIYVNVKVEEDVVTDSTSQEDFYECVEYLDDDEDKYVPEDEPSSSQASPPERRKQKYPQKLPKNCRNMTYKQYTMSDLREAVNRVLCGDMQCADAARMYGIPRGTLQVKLNEAAETKEDETKGTSDKHYQLIEDIKKILEYTNAVPFRTKANRYYCIYCPADGPFYEDPDELRAHAQATHGDERLTRIEHFMKPAWTNEVIKLDVNNLQCTECCIPLPDWNNMFVHFAEAHSIGFDEGYTKIIPYALTSDLVCVLCHQGFHNFGQVDAHMNQHYSNYICYHCGDTFLAVNRLEKHLTVHKVGSYPCSLCDKEFTLERYRAKHCALVHRLERKVKCLYCAEKFVDQFHRHRHVTEAHKEKVNTITCEVCGKIFTWKAYFLAHMRKRHRGEKKHKCQFCPKVFLMPHELKNHLVKHTGERNFVCLCGESFKRAIELRRHVQAVHDKADTIIGI